MSAQAYGTLQTKPVKLWYNDSNEFLTAGELMPRFVHILLQCLWGAPQTLLGLLLFVLQYRRPHYRYHNAVVTEWQAKANVSLGPFIFLTANAGQHKSRIRKNSDTADMFMLKSFYGYRNQSHGFFSAWSASHSFGSPN